MAAKKILKPVKKLKLSRYRPEIHGWRTSHLMLAHPDKIAVAGYNDKLNVTFIDLLSEFQPFETKEIYESTDRVLWPRYICFLEKSQLIATCADRTLQLHDFKMRMPLNAQTLDGEATCMTSHGDQIFVAFFQSRKIAVYDPGLKKTKTIFLESIDSDWPLDITVTKDPFKIFVCTTLDNKALQYNENGFLRCKYNNLARPHLEPWSITVSKQLDQLFILWGKEHIQVHSLSNNRLLHAFYVDDAYRIRANHIGQLYSISRVDGDIKVYDVASLKTPRKSNKDTTISC